MINSLKVIGKVFLVILDNFVGIPVYLITFLLLRLWRHVFPKLYWTLESFIFRELMFIIAHWSWLGGVKIVEYGDDPADYVSERCLVLPNHQSTADVPILLAAFCRKFPAGGQLMWIQDKLFKWTHFGICSQLHGDFFIEQGREKRHLQADLLRSHLHRKYWSRGRNWIIIFPEGGFLYKRLADSQKYAQKNGFPVLHYSTLPRIGAMKAVLETCRFYDPNDEFDRQVKYLIDVTIIYQDIVKSPNFWDLLVGTKSKASHVHIVYRVFPASEIPIDDEAAMLKYMYDVWVSKEKLLEKFYSSSGEMPSELKNYGRELQFSYSGVIFHRAAFVIFAMIYFRIFYHLLPFVCNYLSHFYSGK